MMESSQQQAPKLFARDLISYNDAELDKYIEENGRFIAVEDPDNLFKDKRFIERLRARAGPGDAATSGVLDLDYIVARLEDIPADREFKLRSVASSTPSVNEERDNIEYLAKENHYYNKLVNDGGRPSHPVSLGQDILRDPGQYRDIISYWQHAQHDSEGKTWRMFMSQWEEWERFRENQQYSRTNGRFPAIYQMIQDRLTKHGFKHQFRLNEDISKQDKLTTWIEFLEYEYRTYDEFVAIMNRHQPDRDEAWTKLLESSVLLPFETEECLDGWLSFRLYDEEIAAQKTLESTEISLKFIEDDVETAQSAGTSPRSLSQLERKLSAEKNKMETATKSLESATTRRKYIIDYLDQSKSYRIAKTDASVQSRLLPWMLQQIPLIESELSSENGAKDGSAAESDRKRETEHERANHPDKDVSKRQKQDGESHITTRSKTPTPATRTTPSIPEQRQTRGSRDDPSVPPSNPALAPRATNKKKPEAEESRAVMDEGTRAKKARRPKKPSSDPTPDAPPLRRSTRARRPPERYQ